MEPDRERERRALSPTRSATGVDTLERMLTLELAIAADGPLFEGCHDAEPAFGR